MSGKNPLPNEFAYEGVRAVNPPELIKARRIPTTNDRKYAIGTLWVDTVTQASYQLVAAPGIWVALGISSGPLNTLTGDAGGAIAPGAGNITLAGTANQITTTGAGSTITFSIPATFTAPGSIEATTTLTATLGDITATDGDLVLGTAGNKINIAVGANASVGTSAAMTAGAITIATTSVTASSIIFLTTNTIAGTPGTLSAPVASIVAATSFDIVSSSATDTSTVNWIIIN